MKLKEQQQTIGNEPEQEQEQEQEQALENNSVCIETQPEPTKELDGEILFHIVETMAKAGYKPRPIREITSAVEQAARMYKDSTRSEYVLIDLCDERINVTLQQYVSPIEWTDAGDSFYYRPTNKDNKILVAAKRTIDDWKDNEPYYYKVETWFTPIEETREKRLSELETFKLIAERKLKEFGVTQQDLDDELPF